jgi:alkanesulfonate monooxygenase SsuD/methylene tetrahydromethanopterin reductase-like flavin-dependent oxidoreductase (luciferase family)
LIYRRVVSVSVRVVPDAGGFPLHVRDRGHLPDVGARTCRLILEFVNRARPTKECGTDGGLARVTALRFGVMIFPDAPISDLTSRMRQAEEWGFDQLVLPDHIGDLRNLSGAWHDSWTLLAVAATVTHRIRIGALVGNPILRPPAVVAKQALTLDHLSTGRLDVGLGAGIFAFDHDATGTPTWQAKERMQRFDEYTQIVDGVLRGAGVPFNFDGQWLWAHAVPTAPGPVQQPRPPIVVGGQSPTILRVAAKRADVWNTHGPLHVSLDDLVTITGKQNRQLDDLCTTAGRDPRTLRRALTLFGAADPWSAPVTLDQIVDRFTRVGIEEFVIHWPSIHRSTELERLSLELIPTLRG